MFDVDVKNKRGHTLSPNGFNVVPLLDDKHILELNHTLNGDRDFNVNSGIELLFFHLFALPYRLEDV